MIAAAKTRQKTRRKSLEYLNGTRILRRGRAARNGHARTLDILRGCDLERLMEEGARQAAHVRFEPRSEATDGISAEAGGANVRCVYRGRGLLLIGDKPICVDADAAAPLEILLELRAASTPQLQDKGIQNPSRAFRNIRERYPDLAPYIELPGGKSRGGYRTTIERVSIP